MPDSVEVTRAAARLLKAVPALLLAVPWAIGGSAFGAGWPDSGEMAVPRGYQSVSASAAGPIRFRTRDGEILLSLEEAIQLALERNLDLLVNRITLEQSALDVEAADALYDLGLAGSLSGAQSAVPTIDGLPAGPLVRNDNQAFRFGVSSLVPSGGSVSLDLSNSRAATNVPLATINPTYSSMLSLVFNQPLLAGRGRRVTEAGLEVARINRAISTEAFELTVTATVARAIDAYWGMVGAVEQLKVAELGLEQGRQLYEQSRLKVEGGLIPPLELVQSEFGVATREEAVILARAAVDASADRMRSLLAVRSPQDWNAPIHPETRPEPPAEDDPGRLGIEQAIDLALRSRPELRQQQLSQEVLELGAYVADQAVQPQLDLSVGYDLTGVGGTIIERDPISGVPLSRAGGADDALGQVIDRDFSGWTVGLNFRYPLGNQAARAQSARSQLDVELGRLRQDELEIRILGEVHQAHRALETARQTLRSARLSTRLAEKNLEAETLRFENGRSTSFRLVDIQTDLNNARSREVTATTAYRQAQAELYRVTGQLLQELRVEIVD